MGFQRDLVRLDGSFDTKEEAIRYYGRLLSRGSYVEEDYIEAMIQYDNDPSVHIGNLIAIPHGADEAKEKAPKPGITVIQVPDDVNFGTEDNPQIAAALSGIAGIGNEHLEMIRKVSTFCADVDDVIKLAGAQSKDEAIRLLNNVG